MKVFVGILIGFGVAGALFVFRPFQLSGNVTDVVQTRVEPVEARQGKSSGPQGDRAGKRLLQQQAQSERQLTLASQEMAANQSGRAQKSALASKNYQNITQRGNRLAATGSGPNLAAKSRTSTQPGGRYRSSPEGFAPGAPGTSTSGQGYPVQPTPSTRQVKTYPGTTYQGRNYNNHAGNQGQQVPRQYSRPAQGVSPVSGFNTSPGAYVADRVPRTSGQPLAYAQSQRYRGQTADQLQQYHEANEPVDCSYRDDKLTCK